MRFAYCNNTAHSVDTDVATGLLVCKMDGGGMEDAKKVPF